jgi:hypothetical protein
MAPWRKWIGQNTKTFMAEVKRVCDSLPHKPTPMKKLTRLIIDRLAVRYPSNIFWIN